MLSSYSLIIGLQESAFEKIKGVVKLKGSVTKESNS